MIHILHRFLSDLQIQKIISVSGSHHHDDDDGGHISSTFRATKPYQMTWLSDLLNPIIADLPIEGLVGVDANMQVYRLSGKSSAVPLHVDEDFIRDNESSVVARYSILLRLNSNYRGGETYFPGIGSPNIPVGGGIVFKHNLPHQGLPLLSGEKLVLKTDVFVN